MSRIFKRHGPKTFEREYFKVAVSVDDVNWFCACVVEMEEVFRFHEAIAAISDHVWYELVAISTARAIRFQTRSQHAQSDQITACRSTHGQAARAENRDYSRLFTGKYPTSSSELSDKSHPSKTCVGNDG